MHPVAIVKVSLSISNMLTHTSLAMIIHENDYCYVLKIKQWKFYFPMANTFLYINEQPFNETETNSAIFSIIAICSIMNQNIASDS